MIPVNGLRSDSYSMSLWLSDYHLDHCVLEKALKFDVFAGPPEVSPDATGSVYLPVKWRYEPAREAIGAD